MIKINRKGLISSLIVAFTFLAGLGGLGIHCLIEKKDQASYPEDNIQIKKANAKPEQINITSTTDSVQTIVGNGYWKYDKSTSPATLTLNNLTLDMRGGEPYESVSSCAAIYIVGVDVNLVLEGDNYVYGGYNEAYNSSSKTYLSTGIFSNFKLNFTGSGSLHLYGGSYKNRSDIGPQCSQGALLAGTLICKGPSLYIYGGKTTNTNNTTGANYYGSLGISTFGGVEVDKGLVHIEGEVSDGNSYGWICSNKTYSEPTLSVSDVGEFYATGNTEAAYLVGKSALAVSSGNPFGSTVYRDSANNLTTAATLTTSDWTDTSTSPSTSGKTSEYYVGTEKAKSLVVLPAATRTAQTSTIKAANIVNSYQKETLTFYEDDKTTLDEARKEYSTDNGTTWTEFPGSKLSLTNILTTSAQTLLFRYASTGTTLASASTSYALNARRSDYPTGVKATIGTNSTTAKTFYVSSDYVGIYQYQLLKQYQYETEIAADKWTTITSSAFQFDSESTDSIYIRSIYDKANSHYGSASKIVSPVSQTVLDLAAAITIAANSTNDAFTLSGFVTGEYYSTDAGANWTAVSTSTIDFAPGTNILISSTNPETPSEDIKLTYVSKVLPSTPAGEVDYETEKITGLIGGRKYSITSGSGTATEYTANADGEIALSSLSPDAFGNDVSIVLEKTLEDIDSLAQKIAVLPRSSMPATASYSEDPTSEGKVLITGLNDGEEYSLDGGLTWTAVPSGATSIAVDPSTELTEADLDYRTKATAISAASEINTLVVPKITSLDGSTIQYDSKVFSGLASSETYFLYLDGVTDPVEIPSDSSGKCDISSISALYGKKAVKIVSSGDGSHYINSVPYVFASPIQLVSKLAVPQPNDPVSAVGSFTITGLTGKQKYVLTDKAGATHEVTADADGNIVISGSSNSNLAGLEIVSILAEGDDKDYLNSDANTAIDYVLPSQVTIAGSPAYNASTGNLSSLDSQTSYVLTDSDGNTYAVTSNADGFIDLATAYPETVNKTIASIVKKATDASHIDSAAFTFGTSFKVYEHLTSPTASFDQTTGILSGLDSDSSYIFYYETGSASTPITFTTGSGQTSYDLTSLTPVSGTVIGCLAVGLIKASTDTSVNSDSLEEALSGTILKHEDTPNVSYSSSKDEITGIVAGKTYIVTFADGTSKEYATAAGDTYIDVHAEAGKTLASIAVKGVTDSTSNSLSQSLSSKILTKPDTPNPIILNSIGTYTFSNLVPGQNYTFIDSDDNSYTLTADSNGCIVFNSSSNELFIGLNFKSIIAAGDGTSTIDSDAKTGPWTIPSREDPMASYQSSSGLLYLSPNCSYTIYASDGSSYSFKTDSTGHFDLAAVNPSWVGKTVNGIVKYASDIDHFDSAKTAFYGGDFKVLPHLAAPSAVFDQTTGILTGLEGTGHTYEIFYKDANGNDKTYDFPSSGTSEDLSTLDGGTLLGFTITGLKLATSDSTTYSDSFTEALTGKILPHESTPSVSYVSSKDEITGIVAGKTYIVTFADGTSKEYATSAGDPYIDVSAEAGKAMASVAVKGVADSTSRSLSQSLSGTILTKLSVSDLTVSSEKGSYAISGLTPGQLYVLTDKSGAAHEVAADASGRIVVSDSLNRDLSGLEILSVTAKGDQSSTVDSDAKAVDFVLPSKEVISGSPSYDSQTGVLTGLDPNASYVLTASDGTSVEVASDADGKADLAVLAPSLVGKTIVSLAESASDPEHIASDSYDVSDFAVLAHLAAPSAAADYANMALTGLDSSLTYKVTVDGKTTEMKPDASGTLPIDDTWLGKKVTIVAKGDGSHSSDSLSDTVDLLSKSDLISKLKKEAEAEVESASDKATDKVKSVKSSYLEKIEALVSDSSLTYKDMLDQVGEVVKEGTFEVKKEEVIENVQALSKECQGKDLIDSQINTAVDELEKMDYKTSDKDDLEKVYTDTKEKVSIIINKEVMPNRLVEAAQDLLSEYPYTDKAKAEIQEIVASYSEKIKAAGSSQEQETLYEEALDKISEVETGEVKTANQDTSYGSDYDYSSSGLIGTVSGDGFDVKSTLDISIYTDPSGDSLLKGDGISEDYLANISITANGSGSLTGYTVRILLPDYMQGKTGYKIITASGEIIDAQVDEDGYMTFQTQALGSYRLVSDYEADYLIYVSLPLLGIILLQFGFVVFYLNKESKDEKGQERK